MTDETKKALYWTACGLGAIVAFVVVLWFLGLIASPLVQ